MIVHVLPGDAQAEEFSKTGLYGEVVVCREALIDGDVRAATLEEFWKVREAFLRESYPDAGFTYRDGVVSEFNKLLDLPADDEVNLWFEYELFCHVNMWFTVWLLRESKATLYRVAPVTRSEAEVWNGFGRMQAAELKDCFAERVRFAASDIALGADLWVAYQNRDHAKLKDLSHTGSPCFPHLKEACQAEIEKEFRPKQVLKEIRQSGVEDFGETFAAFREQAGVYGFGDLQVKRILNQI